MIAETTPQRHSEAKQTQSCFSLCQSKHSKNEYGHNLVGVTQSIRPWLSSWMAVTSSPLTLLDPNRVQIKYIQQFAQNLEQPAWNAVSWASVNISRRNGKTQSRWWLAIKMHSYEKSSRGSSFKLQQAWRVSLYRQASKPRRRADYIKV